MEKASREVNPGLEDFKQLVIDLAKYRNSTDIDPETKKVIQDLSVTLRYQLEFDLMKKLVSESPSLKDAETLLKNMIDKITLYKNLLIDEHVKSGSSEMNIRTRIKLKALERSLERLELLNETLKNRNFNSYVIAMNNQVSSTRQLIAIIKQVLTDGYDSYFSTELIKGDVVDENIMTIIYSIMRDKELFEQLKVYVDEEKRIEQMKANNEKEKKCYEVLKQSVNYTTFFKRYITLSPRLSELDGTEAELKTSLNEDYSQEKDLSSQAYSRALYKNQLRKLEKDIVQKEEQLRKIGLQRREYEIAEQKLRAAGFGEILDAFQTKIILANDVYEKFAIYIKSKASSDAFDIEKFLKSFEERLYLNEKQVEISERKLEASLDSKYPLARKLIREFHADTRKIVELFSSDDDMSKVIAFYVLDLLCSSKKFDMTELNEGFPYSKELPEITNKIEESLSNEIKKITEEAVKVENDADRVMRVS